MKEDLLESLPQEIREGLQWRRAQPECYIKFRNHVRANVNSILYHRGKIRSPINAVTTCVGQTMAGMDDYDDHHSDDHFMPHDIERSEIDEVLAFMTKMGMRPRAPRPGVRTDRRPASTPADRRKEPRRDQTTDGPGNRRCVNCGSREHLTRECPKPEVAKDKRPCWKCGKPGHIGAQCRSSGEPVKLVDEGLGEG